MRTDNQNTIYSKSSWIITKKKKTKNNINTLYSLQPFELYLCEYANLNAIILFERGTLYPSQTQIIDKIEFLFDKHTYQRGLLKKYRDKRHYGANIQTITF